MLEFLLALLTTATVALLLVPLLKPRLTATARLDNDLAIYRDQLAELDRERAAGTLPEAEATAARVEIERRILVAAEQDAHETRREQSATLQRFLSPALCLAIPLIALGIYLEIGRPGLPSAPFVPHAAAPAAPNLADEIAAAKKNAAEHPDDPEALSALGEALTMEADGVVTQPAFEAFTRALRAQPGDARAIYYLGLHEAQAGDSPAALKRWRALEAQSPPEAPWLAMLRAEIARVSRESGMPVPSQDQVEAMGRLSPEERQKTIRTMVDGLAARMEANPADRDGWLRLANARKVLGDNPRASEAFAKADALKPVDGQTLVDWAEAEVRQIPPGMPPPASAVKVLERLEKAEPRNALALFYLGAASLASGDKKAAAQRWKTLLALLPADAPIRAMIEEKIKETE
ncbi:MAG: c-type cytochrome biogenesis protein CcmI [Proteobacteria bacterium]|nr:c-type cytochrome biogenesis protein CcmI [Pseudomonadota bacterium]